MINFRSCLAGAAIAATATIALPSQAATLTGSISISGDATLTDTTVVFEDFAIQDQTDSFSSVTGVDAIETLILTEVAPDIFSVPAIDNFIDFGTQTIGGETAALTFDLDATTVTRFSNPFGFVQFAPLSGVFEFGDETLGNGFFSASIAGGNDAYEVTLTAIPEPTTMGGVLLSLGALFWSKKQAGKKSAE